MYSSNKTVAYETLVKEMFVAAYPEFMPLTTPVDVEIDARFGVPTSVSKKRQYAMIMGEIPPQKKPDWDNIAKIICDALNGIAWRDDKQIRNGSVCRKYSECPRVYVTIREIEKCRQKKNSLISI
jgi:Holliday junction resolvase RusA-like endonuclease